LTLDSEATELNLKLCLKKCEQHTMIRGNLSEQEPLKYWSKPDEIESVGMEYTGASQVDGGRREGGKYVEDGGGKERRTRRV
jgi:hypothetical protein